MSGLPTGTVTFLFTDIEGSTLLWQKHPAAMPSALARHHALLRSAIEAHQGHVFQIVGDGFCAAFANVSDAVCAALEAQRRLKADPWGETGPLSVRMALNSGVAELRAGDYTSGEYASGLTLSRCARLLGSAHGEQIVLSRSAAALVEADLPPDVELLDLGEHRLKDLVRPEHVYQLVVSDLRSEFPPLRTLDSFPNNLPTQLTSFIGRERELGEIRELLARVRLLSLTGVGGTGKTRLALQAAAEELDRFSDGVWLVELAPLADPALVVQTVAGVLGLRQEECCPLLDMVIAVLRERQVLLILDNCEHLIDACARLADQLLRACPKLTILATSREALGIAGETPYHVPSLSLPAGNSDLERSEAARLFAERARTLQPSFSNTEQNAAAVAQICRRLDGIPLALELAAARIRVLSVEQIAQRLDDRFRFLTGGSRTALPRQQTLRALIDWSYGLLSEAERVLFRRLSVLTGGWSLEAAQAVCGFGPLDSLDVLDLLSRLVDKSLVMAEPTGETVRYRMMETIRQYARDRLGDSEEGPQTRDSHLDYFLEFARDAERKLHGPDELEWLARLDVESDNLRAALDWSTGPGRVEHGLALALALASYWNMRARAKEGMERAGQLLAQPEAAPRTLARAGGLFVLGFLGLAGGVGEYQATLGCYEEMTSIAREHGDAGLRLLAFGLLGLGDLTIDSDPLLALSQVEKGVAVARTLYEPWILARGLTVLGRHLLGRRDYANSLRVQEEGLAICRSIRDRRQEALLLRGIANIDFYQGQKERTHRLYEESLSLLEQVGERYLYAQTLGMLSEVELIDGDYERSEKDTLEAIRLRRELGVANGGFGNLARLGYIALCRDDGPAARTHFVEALRNARGSESRSGTAYSLMGLAAVAAMQGKAQEAIPLFAFFDAFFETGDKQSFTPMDEFVFKKYLALAKSQVDQSTFDEAWTMGRALTVEQAMARVSKEMNGETDN